ncbi:3-hydroxyanthranilate 3,4-dioxygenase [Dothidotthia symphoricarpi CBS 119687]|uniref:3-hydroxyanthranilate 3,4-dioxygenase n=1 Tax=Dothidotthia symphoricarpi CBS 119687 TaxID=1392245 RepID=A0A6A6AL48_9PLEO|nr:3-hydroxyanthranilate 3,4-dioxygenase [Dothidotthia symphoricarpi CBS 119687]KAF2132530.1 3-hydroxyanthranilate 3,4-dioxygenase [Dothidotthia symphoricarpi CBS 119687]
MRCLRPATRLLQSSVSRPLVRTSGALSQREFSHTTPRRLLGPPLNIPKWISENSHMLKPPINNYCVYNSSVTVMIVGGPNERTDYHINETAEWFYQHKGSMLLKVVDTSQPPDSQFQDIHIHEGDMFLLPPNTPHNPVRFKDTVGIVLEQKRPEGSLDRLRWYCQNCGEKVHEKSFHCTDLGTQIKDAVNTFKADTGARKCKSCGTICDTAPQPKA